MSLRGVGPDPTARAGGDGIPKEIAVGATKSGKDTLSGPTLSGLINDPVKLSGTFTDASDVADVTTNGMLTLADTGAPGKDSPTHAVGPGNPIVTLHLIN